MLLFKPNKWSGNAFIVLQRVNNAVKKSDAANLLERSIALLAEITNTEPRWSHIYYDSSKVSITIINPSSIKMRFVSIYRDTRWNFKSPVRLCDTLWNHTLFILDGPMRDYWIVHIAIYIVNYVAWCYAFRIYAISFPWYRTIWFEGPHIRLK